MKLLALPAFRRPPSLPTLWKQLRQKLVDANWPAVGIGVTALGLAFYMGRLAATGNIILATVCVGATAVITLMFFPAFSVWVILVLPLSLSGFLALAGPLASKITWVVSVLSLILAGPALLQLVWQRRAPLYVWMGLAFMIYAMGVSLSLGIDAKQIMAGFKRYFQGYGLMFALATLGFAAVKVQRWRQFFNLLALMQLPMCLFQLFVLVPLRGGFTSGESTDVVAGTFGGSLLGGSNSSDLTWFQMTALAFLLAQLRLGTRTLAGSWRYLLIVVAPFAMGESKVVVLMLPLCLVGVYFEQLIRQPMRLLAFGAVGAFATFGLALLYAEVFVGNSLPEVINDTIRYNFQDVGYGTNLLNRWTVLTFWSDNHSISNLNTLLFGHGLSASYSSLTPGESGNVAARYIGLGIDLSAASTLLWDLGVIGLTFMVSILLVAIGTATRLSHRHPDPKVRADAVGIRTGLALLMLYFPYTNSAVNLITTEVLLAALLGYLAVLTQSHGQAPDVPHG